MLKLCWICQPHVRYQENLASSRLFHQRGLFKYVSVGYYPPRDYQPLVEFVAAIKIPVRLTLEHVRTFAEHLQRICEIMCGDKNVPVWMSSSNYKQPEPTIHKPTSHKIALYYVHVSCSPQLTNFVFTCFL